MAPLWPANTYAQYRPGYPPHVLERVYEFAALSQRELALDVACGTGQASRPLRWGKSGGQCARRRCCWLGASCRWPGSDGCCCPQPTQPHFASPLQVAVSLADTFERVVAQDSSASQIAAAQPRPNIRYEQAPAEASGLADASVDLVTAAQCMHWCGHSVTCRHRWPGQVAVPACRADINHRCPPCLCAAHLLPACCWCISTI